MKGVKWSWPEFRKVQLDGKPLGDGLKAWSQGDEGKTFIAAKVNGGGGSGGQGPGEGKPNTQTGKSITIAEYDQMQATNPGAAGKFFAEGGQLVDATT